jgi:hypothetical protein
VGDSAGYARMKEETKFLKKRRRRKKFFFLCTKQLILYDITRHMGTESFINPLIRVK